jgi:uncharacterized protein (DUF1778 family)
MKTPVKGNRDVLVKESRLEIRLSKVQKETIKATAEKHGLDLSNYVLKCIFPKSK